MVLEPAFPKLQAAGITSSFNLPYRLGGGRSQYRGLNPLSLVSEANA